MILDDTNRHEFYDSKVVFHYIHIRVSIHAIFKNNVVMLSITLIVFFFFFIMNYLNLCSKRLHQLQIVVSIVYYYTPLYMIQLFSTCLLIFCF